MMFKIALLPFLLVMLCQLVQGQSLSALQFEGENPGNLDAFIYVPDSVRDNIPLVVALHGCSQKAASLAEVTGWNVIAKKYGFAVLYPQQRLINNPSGCFNWFNRWHAHKDRGEAASIKNLIDFTIRNYPVDTTRIFVYGVSAGAAMGVCLMVNYPEKFSAGAALAGIPFGAAKDLVQGMAVLAKPVYKTGGEWAQLVRSQNPDYMGPYPKLIAVHGTSDPIVDIQNSKQLLLQWSAINNRTAIANKSTPNFANHPDITRSSYVTEQGTEYALYYEIKNLGHAISVFPGDGELSGGKTGPFSVDKKFFSTYWIARDFGLIKNSTD